MIRPDFTIFDTAVKASPAKASTVSMQQMVRAHQQQQSQFSNPSTLVGPSMALPSTSRPSCPSTPRTPNSLKKRKDSGSSSHPSTIRRELERKLLESDHLILQYRHHPTSNNADTNSAAHDANTSTPSNQHTTSFVAGHTNFNNSSSSSCISTLSSLLGLTPSLLCNSAPREFLFSPGPSPLPSPALVGLKPPRSPIMSGVMHGMNMLTHGSMVHVPPLPNMSLLDHAAPSTQFESEPESPPPEQESAAKRPLTTSIWQAQLALNQVAAISAVSPSMQSTSAVIYPASGSASVSSPMIQSSMANHRRSASIASSCASSASTDSVFGSEANSCRPSASTSVRGSFSGSLPINASHATVTVPVTQAPTPTHAMSLLAASGGTESPRSNPFTMHMRRRNSGPPAFIRPLETMAPPTVPMARTPTSNSSSTLTMTTVANGRDRAMRHLVHEPGAPVAAFNVFANRNGTQQQQQQQQSHPSFASQSSSSIASFGNVDDEPLQLPLSRRNSFTSPLSVFHHTHSPSPSRSPPIPSHSGLALTHSNSFSSSSLASSTASPLASAHSYIPYSSRTLDSLMWFNGGISNHPIVSGYSQYPQPPPLPSSLPTPLLTSVHFQYLDKIGRGSFGEVWKVRRLKSHAGTIHDADHANGPSTVMSEIVGDFAIKKHLHPIVTISERRSIMRRTEFIKQLVDGYNAQLRHQHASSSTSPYAWPPHLLTHHLIWQESGLLHTLTEYCSLGDLFQFFRVGAAYFAGDASMSPNVNGSPLPSPLPIARTNAISPLTVITVDDQDMQFADVHVGRTRSCADMTANWVGPETKQLEEEDVVQIMLQISEILSIFHSQSILHNDVKPDNIYVTRCSPSSLSSSSYPYDFKLGDLGSLASLTDWINGDSEGDGSYLAPEVLNPSSIQSNGHIHHNSGAGLGLNNSIKAPPHITPKIDIYAFGATLYTLITGEKFVSSVLQSDIASATADLLVGMHDIHPPPSNHPALILTGSDMMVDCDATSEQFHSPTSRDGAHGLPRAVHSQSNSVSLPARSRIPSSASHETLASLRPSHRRHSLASASSCEMQVNSASELPSVSLSSSHSSQSSLASPTHSPIVSSSSPSPSPTTVRDNEVYFPPTMTLSTNVQDMIRRMVSIYPATRPTSEELHQWATKLVKAKEKTPIELSQQQP